MNKYRIVCIIASCTIIAVPAMATEDSVFAEKADEIVDQLLLNEEDFGKSRSFVIEPTRAIAVRAKNKQGNTQTMTVILPESSFYKGAKLKVEFDVNSSNLRPSAYGILSELGKALEDERVAGNRICIKGHTDSDSDEQYNLTLSYKRANSVKNYLGDGMGIAQENLITFGYGESLPLVGNTGSINKQKNRRVEVSLNCPEISSVQQ
ncbi:MAG: OmpA family protein [Desulfobulbaceae bacterium]|nr:OmpA family protein [Desulfobulbaceae bacterium]